MQVVSLIVAVMAAGERSGYGCVLFEKCIVDASIFIFAMHTSFLVVCFVEFLCLHSCLRVVCGCVCRCCCKCFRAFGGCLGTRSR
ncbi:Uncharacterised protein [Mycobacteroides abscessus subsp. abscessus]|nr:Uncharacterised protein [Mycobacteroides abscessus subsp. abscessus]